MNRVSAPVSPPSQTTASRSTASKYSSNLARSWPPSASPNSLDDSLQVRTLMASKCISPNSLDHGLQVHLQTHSITASKFPRLCPPSASPNSLDYGLQVHTLIASKCISPNSYDYGVQVCTIMASECISKFTQSRCGKMVELEGRQPIINTPLHLA